MTAAENASVAYQSPLLIASGTDAKGVALMTTFVNVILSFVCMKSPSVVEKLGSIKRITVFLTLANIVTWIPLLLVIFFMKPVNPVLLVVLWVISLIPSALIAPSRDGWLAELIPQSQIGRYLGFRSAISSAAYLSGFFVMGYILDVFNGQIFHGFTAIFSIGLAATIISFILYIMIRAPGGDKVRNSRELGFLDFIREVRKGNFGLFILFVNLFNFSTQLCGPLYAVYMLSHLNLNYMTFAIILSAEYFGRIFSVTFWGRRADSEGSISTMRAMAYLIPIIPVLWLFSSNIFYLMMIQFFAGTLWAGFDLCNQSYIYKASPQKNRPRYIVYNRSLTLLSTALAGLVGAYALGFMFPVFGSKIFGLFLLSGIFRFLVVKFVFHKLVDLSLSFSDIQPETLIDWSVITKGVAAHQGLFYKPADWKLFQKSPQSPILSRAMPVAGTATPRRGLYYLSGVVGKVEVIPGRHDPSPERDNQHSASSRWGYYYRPQEWKKFLKHAAVNVNTLRGRNRFAPFYL
ncbi:MAG: MFS transporter [Dehalococcoidia bacterium]|nr:MFS transporter [Dehalococcoidia bacterium]MDZ4246156.1 MFS transporter [Dehalococcoidia bacterium]